MDFYLLLVPELFFILTLIAYIANGYLMDDKSLHRLA